MHLRTRTKKLLGGLIVVNVALWGTVFVMAASPTVAMSRRPHVSTPRVVVTPASLRTLQNLPAALPPGPVIVEAFAPWCMYCATTARWEDAADAAWAHAHHIGLVLTAVSPLGGIGTAAQAPTLASIQATAHDGTRTPLASNAAIAANLRRFQSTYHLTLPVDFWAQGTPPAAWRLTALPTFLYLNARHQIVGRLVGYHSVEQFRAWTHAVRLSASTQT